MKVSPRDSSSQSPGRLIGEHARAADALVDQVADGQRIVAHHLGGQAETRTARQQPILRVFLEKLGADLRRLPVGGRGDDQALHRLDVPVALKLAGQPVQHVALYGRIALRSEILRRLDQAGAEIQLPVAVDGHARGERMLRAEQPLRQAQAIRRRVLGQRREAWWARRA